VADALVTEEGGMRSSLTITRMTQRGTHIARHRESFSPSFISLDSRSPLPTSRSRHRPPGAMTRSSAAPELDPKRASIFRCTAVKGGSKASSLLRKPTMQQ